MTSALILAAGMGTRLMPLTKDKPKALVEIGSKTLLAGLIEACAAGGLDDAVVVTGCLAEVVDNWVASHSHPIPVRTVFNDAFDTRGNAWSVYVARDTLTGDFIKLDGDLIVDPEIIANMVRRDGSALALDKRGELDAEAMKAATDAQGQVCALGKWLSVDEAAGESIGIERIAAADAATVFDGLRRIVVDQPNAYYEDAYHQLIESGSLTLGAYDIGQARWAEIDSAADLEHAEALFAP